MDFSFTKEQKKMLKMVQNFTTEMVNPKAAEIDKYDRFPRDIFNRAAEIGLLAINFPKKYGGSGGDTVSAISSSIEISSVSAAVANIVSSVRHHLFCLYHYGTEEQKKMFMPAIASGQLIGSFALSEFDSGSDASNIKTHAQLKGDEYLINGHKKWVTLGTESDFTIVFAITDKNNKRGGISAFIVEKNTPGFKVGKKEEKLGLRGNPVSEYTFSDVRVPKSNILGKEGEGLKIALHSLDSGRIEGAALAVGIIKAAMEDSITYAESRVQFKKKISEFQLIQAFIAEMAADYDASKLLAYQAAVLKDKGKVFTREASIAKWFAAEAAMKHTTNAIQIHGGYGYCKDYDVERYFRDAKLTQIFEGTNQIQQLVIAKEVIKKQVENTYTLE